MTFAGSTGDQQSRGAVVQALRRRSRQLDAALSDALDSQFTAASLARYSFPGRITEVGVERLCIAAPVEAVPATGPQYTVLRMDAVEDAWARDLEMLYNGRPAPSTGGSAALARQSRSAVRPMPFSTRQE